MLKIFQLQGAWRNGSSDDNTPNRNPGSLWQGVPNLWPSYEQTTYMCSPLPHSALPHGCRAGPMAQGFEGLSIGGRNPGSGQSSCRSWAVALWLRRGHVGVISMKTGLHGGRQKLKKIFFPTLVNGNSLKLALVAFWHLPIIPRALSCFLVQDIIG